MLWVFQQAARKLRGECAQTLSSLTGMNCGGTVVCSYAEFPDHFGFFMPLAGITTVEHISENSFEIKATGRLNKLYFELLKDNPDWATRLYLMSLGGLIHKRSLTNRLGIQLGLLPIVTLP